MGSIDERSRPLRLGLRVARELPEDETNLVCRALASGLGLNAIVAFTLMLLSLASPVHPLVSGGMP